MLSDNLKKFRERKGITQEEAAAGLHIVRQTLSKWEKGLSAPDANMLEQIAALYDVHVSELLGSEDTQKKNYHRVFWIVVMVLGILVIVWGCIGTALGIINYNAVLNDKTFSDELKVMILEGCKKNYLVGIRRIIFGVILAVVAGVVVLKKKILRCSF